MDYAHIFSAPKAIFGGPDKPRGALRDDLERRINAVPKGGTIQWATYYFRDLKLAAALVAAHVRGVDVRVVLEAKPRIASANCPVIELLSGPRGLDGGLQLVCLPGVPNPTEKVWKPQFHEKIYTFSHPTPVALVGSFNPSGNGECDDHRLTTQIGDQDTADNLLVELNSTVLVNQINDHICSLFNSPPIFSSWIRRNRQLDLSDGVTSVHFWPRRGAHPVVKLLDGLSGNANVELGASHLRSTAVLSSLIDLASRGAQIRLLCESTRRRVTPRTEALLCRAGVDLRRMEYDGAQIPMHMKLVLAQDGDRVVSAFGSFNWTLPSFYLNHEIAVISEDRALYQNLSVRWHQLEARCKHATVPLGSPA